MRLHGSVWPRGLLGPALVSALVLASEVGAAGCAGERPEAALAAYRAALRAHDSARLWALTDPSVRPSAAEDSFAADLTRDPTALDAAERRLAPEVRRVRRLVELELASGEVVVLADGDGAWRMVKGGVTPAVADTPEHALTTFLGAAASEDLAVVRRLIPARFAAAYAKDDTLAQHLRALGPRLARAAKGLGAHLEAELRGDRAEVAYAGALRAVLVREDGVWKVADLE